MYRFLLKCKIDKKRGRLQILDSTESIRHVLSKVSFQVQHSWNKLAEGMKRKGKEAQFSDLVDFRRQKTKIKDPFFQ